MEAKKRLASIALFRELYEAKKSDSYSVLAILIEYAVNKSSLFNTNSEEIKRELLNQFNFEIPGAVIEQTLKKRLKIKPNNSGYYTFSNSQQSNQSIINSLNINTDKYNSILSDLCLFIEKGRSCTLGDKQREDIVKSFCSYLLDDTSGDGYYKEISEFVIKGSGDKALLEGLRVIKEGVVLYTGLKYTSNSLNQVGLTKPLVFFLDTEILFFAAGYNGNLSRAVFLDFHNLIKELNKSSGKSNQIQLKYFETTKNEVFRFFEKAQLIMQGKDTPIPGKTAMAEIIKGKTSAYQIKEEYAKFTIVLKDLGIEYDTRDNYYSDSNQAYNIESEELEAYFCEKFENKVSVGDDLKNLNFINILRKGDNSTSIENSKFWLLTGKNRVLQMSVDEKIKIGNSQQLASTIAFFINIFWFKQNKGFGSTNDFPKSFDVITKAQIALASHVNNALSVHYDELKAKVEKGEITPEQSIEILAQYRSGATLPEEINESNVESVLSFADNSSIERVVAELESIKTQAATEKSQRVDVEIKLQKEKKDNEIKDIRIQKNEEQITKLGKEVEELTRKAEIEDNKRKKERERQEEQGKARIRRKRRRKRIGFTILVLISIFVISYIFCLLWGSELLGKIGTRVLGIFGALAGALAILAYFGVGPKKIVEFYKK